MIGAVVVGVLMTKKLYITHPEFDIHEVNPKSILINNINIDLDNSDYHTSLGDISPADIISISTKFNTIIFIETGFIKNSSLYIETEILLISLSHFISIENFVATPPLNFVQDQSIYTRPNNPVLWVYGCSHSHGIGLLPLEKRYSDIMQDSLQLPLKSITLPGSSTRWALRHLINSNLEQDDIVVWQITTPERLSIYDSQPREVLLSLTKDRNLLATYTDEQIFFDHLSLINYGVNFLRAKNIKFVLTSIENDSALFNDYKKEYVKYKEYCYSPGFAVDLGTDNIHFGKMSHKNLAFSLLNHINYNYG